MSAFNMMYHSRQLAALMNTFEQYKNNEPTVNIEMDTPIEAPMEMEVTAPIEAPMEMRASSSSEAPIEAPAQAFNYDGDDYDYEEVEDLEIIPIDGGGTKILRDSDIMANMLSREFIYQDLQGGVSIRNIVDNIAMDATPSLTGGATPSLTGGGAMDKIISEIYGQKKSAVPDDELDVTDESAWDSDDTTEASTTDASDEEDDIAAMHTLKKESALQLNGGYIPSRSGKTKLSDMFPYIIHGYI